MVELEKKKAHTFGVMSKEGKKRSAQAVTFTQGLTHSFPVFVKKTWLAPGSNK